MMATKNGYDVGNYSLKVSPDINVKSLITTEENILGSKYKLVYEGKTHYIGEGTYDTKLNKAQKENFIPLLLTGIALSTEPSQVFHQVVCGLPINQYKANKEELEDRIMSQRVRKIEFNDVKRDIIITDCKVYPEAVGAYYSTGINNDVIIVDIGGKTTDIAYIVDKKVSIGSTVNVGSINIYKDIADNLNAEHSLDLTIPMIDRILERGYLKIDNRPIQLDFIIDMLKESFRRIEEDLNLKFPARTEQIVLVGGGAKLFVKAFKNRYSNCDMAENPIFANAIGFKKVGDLIWG